MRALTLVIGASLAAAPMWGGAVEKIALHALFKDKAIVVIDGARRVLKSGDTSPEGVKLVSTDTGAETATLEIDGKPLVMRLGAVGARPGASNKGSATLYEGNGGHFYADGFINDKPARFMVDTGATMVAMSSRHAQQLGLDYRRVGQAGAAHTAGGVVRTYSMRLAKVQVGDIVLHDIEAGIIEGTHPVDILLGMSFLGQLDMKRESNRLELRVP
jgi:aspartyl protease family protein